jgi:hypothetical protein
MGTVIRGRTRFVNLNFIFSFTFRASLHNFLWPLWAERLAGLYHVMDAGYDAAEIYEYSHSLGHLTTIRPVRRQRKEFPFSAGEIRGESAGDGCKIRFRNR